MLFKYFVKTLYLKIYAKYIIFTNYWNSENYLKIEHLFFKDIINIFIRIEMQAKILLLIFTTLLVINSNVLPLSSVK